MRNDNSDAKNDDNSDVKNDKDSNIKEDKGFNVRGHCSGNSAKEKFLKVTSLICIIIFSIVFSLYTVVPSEHLK